MNKLFIRVATAALATISLNAFANNQIIEINEPGTLGGDYSVFIDNGEILEVEKSNTKALEALKLAMESDLNVSILRSEKMAGERSIIESVSFMGAQSSEVNDSAEEVNKEYYSRDRERSLNFQTIDPLSNYNITELDSYDEAQALMDTFNGETRQESQCYNRAHVWTYESFIKHQINLGKVWIFFSKKYIKEYKYKWWFHIAPFAKVKGYDKPFILDRGFTMVPYALDNWKDLYMENKAECKVVRRYSDYTKDTRKEHCFLMFSSQYYWQPKHLKRLEKRGNQKWGFVPKEMRYAYRDALITWDGQVPVNESLRDYDAYQVENDISEMPTFERSRRGCSSNSRSRRCRQ